MMTKEERRKIKDWVYNVLLTFENQEYVLADDSGLSNFENPMFDKAEKYILGHKK